MGASLKIEQHLKNAAMLDRAISLKQNQIQYLENMCDFLKQNTFSRKKYA